jgi:hypothetical protein
LFKAIFVAIIAFCGINVVNAQVSATPEQFQLSLGESQEVSISSTAIIDGVSLDAEESSNEEGINFK